MTQQHSLELTDQTPAPIARKVADHIWQLTLPIPVPLKTVNVYALEGKTGWVLVDAGMGVPETRDAFYTGMAQAGLQLQDLQAIVLTHLHPDHIGLAGELHELTQAPVMMHPLDEAALHRTWADQIQTYIETSNQFLAPHGLSSAKHWSANMSPELLHSILRIPHAQLFFQLKMDNWYNSPMKPIRYSGYPAIPMGRLACSASAMESFFLRIMCCHALHQILDSTRLRIVPIHLKIFFSL
nr:MBL fold metallo-hydrolase [Dictyobacter vulcani]